nr:hypothetical protein [Candidatus Sigynarchaeota archaeon]
MQDIIIPDWSDLNDVIANLQQVMDEMANKPEFARIGPSVARAIANLRADRKLADMPSIPTLSTMFAKEKEDEKNFAETFDFPKTILSRT